MKFFHIYILAFCLLWHNAAAYYTAEQLEQIEQKYESPEEQDFFTSQDQQSAIETLNQAYSQLEPSQVKSYSGSSSSGIPQSLFSSPSYSSNSASLGSPSDSGIKSLEGKSSEYSKLTHIPSGSLFSMSDKGPGPLEFESPFSKQPYSIIFRTHSMPVQIKQQHQTLPAPEIEYIKSLEEAHKIKHEVVRPVIQEVHEIIQPYRRVVQEVRPVQESIHTVISKGEGRGGKQTDGGRGVAGPSVGGGFGGGVGHGRNGGGLSVGYSEHQPRYASPQQHQFRAPVNQQVHHPIVQYSAVSRAAPAHSSRY